MNSHCSVCKKTLMINCFSCHETKTATGDGMFCNRTGLDIDNEKEVEFCKFYSGMDKPAGAETEKVETVTDSLIQKIQKLFELGKSPNINEAAAAIKKAELLMNRYNLSYGKVNYITEKERRGGGKKCYSWELNIFGAVCRANNCYPFCNHGFGIYGLTGRKINVFLSQEMFRYLTDTVKRIANEQCKGKGHKYNHDFKMAASIVLIERIEEYASRVSWAVDRETELQNEEKELKKLKKAKKSTFSFRENEAIKAGVKAGENISLHKQTGIEETKLIGV